MHITKSIWEGSILCVSKYMISGQGKNYEKSKKTSIENNLYEYNKYTLVYICPNP